MNTLHTTCSPQGARRRPGAGRARPDLFAVLLAAAMVLFVAAFLQGVGPAGSEAAFHPPVEPPYCRGPSLDEILDSAGVDEGGWAEDSGGGGRPVRFDCGVGETWRRHLP